ncbi:conserved hypothetical protein [Cupriavidus phytorum]|uniref:Uncharacterized protein n=2 Tax=Cupriavidus TaxID=106589 RepID=A0A976AAR0_9BURK|nr:MULTISPECIES: hypothetical protein [Cupriavidus]PZX34228.1 hypothetical protein C7416_101512 [Cupriavidus alkaliphilus]SOY71884.1 conserved hypothetical protein [Cupriavidus taiwanensis]
MYMYELCKGLKLLEEGVSLFGWWIDPRTGHRLENATYIDAAPNLYGSDGLKSSSIYTYDFRHEYSLELKWDWHDVLAKLVGFDRENPDVYPADGSFIELLHNDYSMEAFGPSAARKIVADFDAWNDRASKVLEKVDLPPTLIGDNTFNDDAFYLTYWWLRSCFANATKNGIVRSYYRLS